MAIDQHLLFKSSGYDYSNRWTVVDNTAKKLIWMTVYEFTEYRDLYAFPAENDNNEITDRIRAEILGWRKRPVAEWIHNNAVEDTRVEMTDEMDYSTLEVRVRVKIMARFHEEIATLYVLKWK